MSVAFICIKLSEESWLTDSDSVIPYLHGRYSHLFFSKLLFTKDMME